MHEPALSIATMTNFHGARQILIRPSQSRSLQDVANDFALQVIGQKCSLVRQSAGTELIASNCREMPVRVIKGFDDLGAIWKQKFFPYRTLILLAGLEGIGCEPLGLREVREFLIVKSGCRAQRSRSHHIADG